MTSFDRVKGSQQRAIVTCGKGATKHVAKKKIFCGEAEKKKYFLSLEKQESSNKIMPGKFRTKLNST